MSEKSGGVPSPTGFFGHPRGLSTLFFTEMWERFSYYGMKAMLFLYLTAAIIEGPQSGLGMGAEKAGALNGLYNSFVYLMALPGGWIADRLIGPRKSVLIGGIIIACGHFSMAMPFQSTFFLGLILIIVGTGLLKPNISTMVGELYPGDMGARRDAGFSIFYMGINIGATVAPLACGFVRDQFGWHLGFGLAGIGMTLGVLWYILDRRYLGDAGSEPTSDPETRAAAYGTATKAGIGILLFIGLLAVLHNTGIFVLSWTGVNEWVGYITLASVALFIGYVAFFTGQSWEQTKKVLAIGLLFVFTALFWSGFEQASTSLNAFARDLTDRTFFGWVMPTEYLQSVNPFFIIVLAPVFGALWIRLAAKNLNPSIPMKFSLGLIQLAAGFLVLMVGAGIAQTNLEDEPNRVSIMWLCTTYLLFTTGELCLSPVGLSTITKLAPREYVSQMMGIWFIAAALGNLIAGRVGGMIEHMPHAQIFRTVAFIVGACGIVMLVFSPLMHRKLMGGVK